MKISVLGTGIMGSGLAEGLMSAGHEVIVYNRTIEKTEGLVKLGAKAVSTPAEAISEADASILVLSDATIVEKVLLNDDVKAVLKGKKILNASTTNPLEIIEIEKKVACEGGNLAEMSILVGTDELRNKEGQFLVGCSEDVEELWNDVLGSVGKLVKRVGVTGDASKAEAPMLIGSIFMGATMAYSAAMSIKLGVPEEVVSQQLGMFVPHAEYFIPGMYARDYSQVMASVDSFRDVAKAAISTAKSLNIPSEALENLGALYEEAAKLGYGAQDGSSIVEVLLQSK